MVVMFFLSVGTDMWLLGTILSSLPKILLHYGWSLLKLSQHLQDPRPFPSLPPRAEIEEEEAPTVMLMPRVHLPALDPSGAAGCDQSWAAWATSASWCSSPTSFTQRMITEGRRNAIERREGSFVQLFIKILPSCFSRHILSKPSLNTSNHLNHLNSVLKHKNILVN